MFCCVYQLSLLPVFRCNFEGTWRTWFITKCILLSMAESNDFKLSEVESGVCLVCACWLGNRVCHSRFSETFAVFVLTGSWLKTPKETKQEHNTKYKHEKQKQNKKRHIINQLQFGCRVVGITTLISSVCRNGHTHIISHYSGWCKKRQGVTTRIKWSPHRTPVDLQSFLRRHVSSSYDLHAFGWAILTYIRVNQCVRKPGLRLPTAPRLTCSL